MTEAYAIKPCPFCGSEAAIRWCGGVLLVECTKCGVSKGDTGGEGESEIRASAIAEWNQRVPVTVSEVGEAGALVVDIADLLKAGSSIEPTSTMHKRIDAYLSRGQG